MGVCVQYVYAVSMVASAFSHIHFLKNGVRLVCNGESSNRLKGMFSNGGWSFGIFLYGASCNVEVRTFTTLCVPTRFGLSRPKLVLWTSFFGRISSILVDSAKEDNWLFELGSLMDTSRCMASFCGVMGFWRDCLRILSKNVSCVPNRTKGLVFIIFLWFMNVFCINLPWDCDFRSLTSFLSEFTSS